MAVQNFLNNLYYNTEASSIVQVTLDDAPVKTSGDLPGIGTKAPGFNLTNAEMNDSTLDDFKGRKIVLSIFSSIETGACAASVRQFNAEVESRSGMKVLCISVDLPFAQSRFCEAEELANVVTLSDFRNKEFGKVYGVRIIDGPWRGLLSRAVVVIDEHGKVVYIEQVREIAEEPNYEAALAHI